MPVSSIINEREMIFLTAMCIADALLKEGMGEIRPAGRSPSFRQTLTIKDSKAFIWYNDVLGNTRVGSYKFK